MRPTKQISSAVVVFVAVAVVIGAAIVLVTALLQPKTTLIIGDGVFQARLAVDETARQKGLGGVATLNPDDAMILAFDHDSTWDIWMKDMLVPLDIVWLDSDKKVVYIVKNVSPDGGESARYKPKSAARYVVELPAGTVDSKSINLGDSAVFAIDEGEVRP